MNAERITWIPPLPERKLDAHKGDVGRLLIVGGSLTEYGMIGAPALTANGALRSGAGLVQIATPSAALPHVALLAPCATTRSFDSPDWDIAKAAVEFGADVVAVGPGAGQSITPRQMVDLLKGFSGGIVVDADAINALARADAWTAKWPHNVVLTPHPGEMRRLLAGVGLDEDISDRQRCALAFARETEVTLVLKGAGTVVTNGKCIYVNQTGNSGMATAGSGDVLTGVIAALMGQGLSAFDAAVLGVHVHGLAGDSAAEQLGRISLTALDLLDYLPEAFCDLEENPSEEDMD